jgi:hypothetical protein
VQENKDRLGSIPGVVPQLVSLLAPGCGEALQTASLRLLHNLSFDAGLRQQMVQAGLVQQVRMSRAMMAAWCFTVGCCCSCCNPVRQQADFITSDFHRMLWCVRHSHWPRPCWCPSLVTPTLPCCTPRHTRRHSCLKAAKQA